MKAPRALIRAGQRFAQTIDRYTQTGTHRQAYTDRPAMPLPVDFFEPEPPTSITTTRLSLAQFTANDAE